MTTSETEIRNFRMFGNDDDLEGDPDLLEEDEGLDELEEDPVEDGEDLDGNTKDIY